MFYCDEWLQPKFEKALGAKLGVTSGSPKQEAGYFSLADEKNSRNILDRDGVINKPAKPHEYIISWPYFIILSGVYEALSLFRFHCYKIFIVTRKKTPASKAGDELRSEVII